MRTALRPFAFALAFGALACQSNAAIVCYDMYSDFIGDYAANPDSAFYVGGEPGFYQPNFHANISFALPGSNLASDPSSEGHYVDDTPGKKLALTIQGEEPHQTKTFDFIGAMTATIKFYGEMCYYTLTFLGGPMNTVAQFYTEVDPSLQIGDDPWPTDTSNSFLLNLTNFAGYFSLNGPDVLAYDDISAWQNRQILGAPSSGGTATNVPDNGSALALLAAGLGALIYLRRRAA